MQPQFTFLIIATFCCNAHSWRTGKYNNTYPLTKPLVDGEIVTFRIGIVADLDTDSKSLVKRNTFHSYFKKGYLSYDKSNNQVSVKWDQDPPVLLNLTYSHEGRGMELSELIVFDGRLVTFDDKSGIVFHLIDNRVVPWLVLSDGDGQTEKGFNTEWATVKDEIMYIGSIGKEWTTATGLFQTNDPMWIKNVNFKGEVQHINWINQYKALRSSVGINWPGYMIHEAAAWSAITNKWYFLPRRCTNESYNDRNDDVMGCNYLITADNDFHKIQALEIGERQSKLGFSSFKFIPGSNDEAIVALKTSEFEGKTTTYITAFKTDGTFLLPDTLIENLKYEGLEFI